MIFRGVTGGWGELKRLGLKQGVNILSFKPILHWGTITYLLFGRFDQNYCRQEVPPIISDLTIFQVLRTPTTIMSATVSKDSMGHWTK